MNSPVSLVTEVSDDPYSGFADFDPQALTNAVQYVIGCGVAGHIAEFGCYQGRSAQVLAKALHDYSLAYYANDEINQISPRHLYLFDSFQGFPEVDNPVDSASPHLTKGIWMAGMARGDSPQELGKRCAQHLEGRRIKIFCGWFKDTMPLLADDIRFALLHMDCDYYQSTFDVLLPLFQRELISDGATILFDDWYCNNGSPEFGQQRAWADVMRQCPQKYTDWGAYGVTGRRFIVHGHTP